MCVIIPICPHVENLKSLHKKYMDSLLHQFFKIIFEVNKLFC